MPFLQAPAQQTDTVKLGLIVTDRDHRSVDDINKDEVQLFEDGKLQSVSQFAKDTRPLQIAIAMDASGSFQTLLGPALDLIKLIISERKPTDEVMLISFISSDKIETIQSFTSDRLKLIDSLNVFRSDMGQSAVIDGTYLAVKAAADHRPSDLVRRVVVLISDGEDRASYYRVDELVKLLRTKDVQVFVVGIVLQLDKKRGLIGPGPLQKSEALLKKIATETGGPLFFPKTNGDLLKTAEQINHYLHSQYLLGFQPTNGDKKGFRNIDVKITSTRGKELETLTRSGYFIEPPDLDPKEKGKKKPE